MLALSAVGAGGDVSVYATLEPPEIPFHKTATYTITVEGPADVLVTLPTLEAAFEGLEFESEAVEEEVLEGERRRVSQRYVLDPVTIKTHAIAGQKITWGDGETLVLPTLSFRVRDLSDGERAQAGIFEDIARPSVIASTTSSRDWWWALAVLAVAVVIGLWFYLRRKEEEVAEEKALPWEVAYQRLEELGRRELPAGGKYGAYYVDLSAILRYYIEDRFEIHAPEQTTPEFLEDTDMRDRHSAVQQDFLANFLGHSDRVKFARYQPTPEEMAEHFSSVKNFVSDTTPTAETTELTEATA